MLLQLLGLQTQVHTDVMESSTPSDQFRKGNGTEQRGSTERQISLLRTPQTDGLGSSGCTDTSQKMPVSTQLPVIHFAHAHGDTTSCHWMPTPGTGEMKLSQICWLVWGLHLFVSFPPTSSVFPPKVEGNGFKEAEHEACHLCELTTMTLSRLAHSSAFPCE